MTTGILVIDKPQGITSFGVVKRVRQVLRVKKAGHTGTLDPLATGVLPVCVGEATKVAGLLLAEDKEYEATGLLGVETDTLDTTGRILVERGFGDVTREQVELALGSLRGAQQQVPPAFSAVRESGVRAYERARRGEKVELAPREVEVHELALTRWAPPHFEIHVACSKGTFVRSLVSEVGRRVGCGATLSALRRLRTGPFTLAQSVALEGMEERWKRGDLSLVTMDEALAHLPAVEITPKDVTRIRQGQPVAAQGGTATGLVRVRSESELVALGEWREGGLWPRRVFAIEGHG